MDPNDLQANGSIDDFAALTQRVAELERMVTELRNQPAPVVLQAPVLPPQARPAPPPMPSLVRFTAPPLPAAPPLSAAPQKSLEDRLGSQVFNMIGIFALICGSAYFLKLAIDHGWLGYSARVLIGLLAGAGVVVWSETFRRKKLAAFSYSLKAVGTAILYLSLWAAFHLYNLLPGPVALVAMILVTAWNAWMAVTQDAEVLAGYALAGGLLTPVLLSSGGDHETFLFTYLAAIALGVVYLLRTKRWSWLLIPTFLGVVGFFIAWYSEFFHSRLNDVWTGASTETALFALLFFAIFALPTLKGWSKLPDAPGGASNDLVPVLLPLGDAVFLALALYSVFEDSGLHNSLAFLMVALAALFLGMMRPQRAVIAGAMYLATAVVCLTVAVPLKASGHSLTTAWLVEGLILYWAGMRIDKEPGQKETQAPATVLWVLSLGGYVLGLGSLVAHWGFAMLFNSQGTFFNKDLAAAMVAVATIAGAVWLAQQRKDAGVQGVALLAIDAVALLLALRELLSWSADTHIAFASADFATALHGLAIIAATCFAAYRISAGRSPIAAGTFVLANLVAILIFVREIGALFTSGEADLQRALAVSAFLMVYGAALLAIGFVKQTAFVRWQALVLLIFTIGKVFLYDMSGLSAGYRVASLMGLGAVLMGVSYAYQKDWLGLKTPAATPVAAPLETPLAEPAPTPEAGTN